METVTLDRPIVFGGAIKALDDNRIGGYLIEYTSEDEKDLQGEYFTAETDQLEDDYPTVGLPVMFNHGMDSKLSVKRIGTIVKAMSDDVGLWVEAILDEHEEYKEYVSALRGLASKGVLSWSSGALPQSVIVDDSGFIKRWAKIEGSLTHTPANPTGTRIQNLKSIASDLSQSIESPSAKETEATELADLSSDLKTVANNISEVKTLIEGLNMETETQVQMDNEHRQAIRDRLDDIKRLLDGDGDTVDEIEIIEAVDAKMADVGDETISEKRFTELIDESIENAFKRANEERDRKESAKALADRLRAEKQAPPVSKAPSYSKGKPTEHISVRTPFNHWTASDFSYAHDVNSALTRAGRKGLPIDFNQAYYREFADKAIDGYEKGESNVSAEAVKTYRALKNDEVMYSTLSSYGDEHVPEAWRDEIWLLARRDNVVSALFSVQEMPTNPYTLPIEGGDPTVYLVPETKNQSTLALTGSTFPDSQVGTSKVTMTASKLGLQVFISRELSEDAVGGAMPLYRSQAQRAMMDSLDNILLNGHTATSGNINYDGDTPATTAKYLAFNGLLANAIVTASSNALDAEGNAPTLSTIRKVRFLLDRSKQRPSDLAIIVPPEVEHKMLNMDEFVTMDKAGNRATNMTGQIGLVDNIPVFVSNEIATADTDGKITYNGNSAETGRMIIVHRPSWYVGYRRQLDLDLQLLPYYDSWVMTATMRVAFANQDNDSVAVLYNVGI